MRLWRCAVLGMLLPLCCRWAPAQSGSGPAIQDVYPDKARYAPHEPVVLLVSLAGAAAASTVRATVEAAFWHLDTRVGT